MWLKITYRQHKCCLGHIPAELSQAQNQLAVRSQHFRSCPFVCSRMPEGVQRRWGRSPARQVDLRRVQADSSSRGHMKLKVNFSCESFRNFLDLIPAGPAVSRALHQVGRLEGAFR